MSSVTWRLARAGRRPAIWSTPSTRLLVWRGDGSGTRELVDRYQLGVTVCHYPTGASKWNPIEHRLFSEISKHWGGQPLTDYKTIARLIGGTRTQTGLVVNCALNTKHYPTKVPIAKQQMDELDLLKHPVLPDWNYALLPRLNRN